MSKILIVDDEQINLDFFEVMLTKLGFEVEKASDGEEALETVRDTSPDLIVLDIMLPGLYGIELLTRLRRESDVYVIMLTAKSEETDKIVGLSVGADDYLTKPFSPRELIARIKAALRRMRAGDKLGETSILSFQHIRMNVAGRLVWVNDEPVELTTVEFDLLRTLAEYPGIVLSREQLLEKVWGYDYFGELRVVDVHIGHIRQKLGDEGLITTVRGIGYRFDDEVM